MTLPRWVFPDRIATLGDPENAVQKRAGSARKLGRDLPEVEIDVPEQLGLASWRVHLERAVAELGLAKANGAAAAKLGRVRLVLRGEADGRPVTVLLNEKGRSLQPRRFAVLMRLVARHERAPEAWSVGGHFDPRSPGPEFGRDVRAAGAPG